jgi:transcriptional regulator with XRE-family HTH domain
MSEGKLLGGEDLKQMLSNLKTALAARRLHQVDVAIELKISPSVLSEIVNGRRSAEASLRARLAEILQADEEWLFSSAIRIPARAATATPASV